MKFDFEISGVNRINSTFYFLFASNPQHICDASEVGGRNCLNVLIILKVTGYALDVLKFS